jgi:RNA-binding protein
LIKRVKARHADVRIGKNGLTEGVLKEIERRLKDHKVVKIKIGIDVEDRREFARDVAKKLNAKLIEVRGYTFILAKEDVRD